MWIKNSSKFYYYRSTLWLLESIISYANSHTYQELKDRLYLLRDKYQNYFDNLWIDHKKQKTLFEG